MPISTRLTLLALVILLPACVAVNPEKSKEEKASAINVELGIGYLQQGNLELANEKLLKALKFNRNNVRANYVYAILQDQLKQTELAEYHYKRATDLDAKNSEAANNYGAFLCRNEREAKAEKYFLRALKNPLYKTPEFAYTNAAICLIKFDNNQDAKKYLEEALAAKSDFASALIVMGDLVFQEGDFDAARDYLDRYHLAARPTAKSLWLSIRTALELNADSNVDELSDLLESDFSGSEEYQAWLKIQ